MFEIFTDSDSEMQISKDGLQLKTEATLNIENYVMTQSRLLFKQWLLNSSLFSLEI